MDVHRAVIPLPLNRCVFNPVDKVAGFGYGIMMQKACKAARSQRTELQFSGPYSVLILFLLFEVYDILSEKGSDKPWRHDAMYFERLAPKRKTGGYQNESFIYRKQPYIF